MSTATLRVYEEPQAACSNCGKVRPAQFTLCAACHKEVPWLLKVKLWTATANAHVVKQQLSPWQSQEAADAAVEAARKAALTHLKQFGSAIHG